MTPALSDVLFSSVVKASRALPHIKNAVPHRIRRYVYEVVLAKSLVRLPDRVFLENDLIDLIASRSCRRILNVGCRRYTRNAINRLIKLGAEVWTLDIDPAAETWGVPGRHIVGDATEMDSNPICYGFDCILFNGVFGWGIDSPDAVARTLTGLHRVMAPGTLLVVGWNTDRLNDIETHAQFGQLFHRVEPGRIRFAGSTHVYDILEPNVAPSHGSPS
ncbi:MAG: class I SAM-dependent methyltransferase [Bacteroidales bacterium]|nr:class I SAM-dependent methyltransferase [Bacteroidales bacterium]